VDQFRWCRRARPGRRHHGLFCVLTQRVNGSDRALHLHHISGDRADIHPVIDTSDDTDYPVIDTNYGVGPDVVRGFSERTDISAQCGPRRRYRAVHR
jgi:hypothetical protein